MKNSTVTLFSTLMCKCCVLTECSMCIGWARCMCILIFDCVFSFVFAKERKTQITTDNVSVDKDYWCKNWNNMSNIIHIFVSWFSRKVVVFLVLSSVSLYLLLWKYINTLIYVISFVFFFRHLIGVNCLVLLIYYNITLRCSFLWFVSLSFHLCFSLPLFAFTFYVYI